jgi:hypothetical protein
VIAAVNLSIYSPAGSWISLLLIVGVNPDELPTSVGVRGFPAEGLPENVRNAASVCVLRLVLADGSYVTRAPYAR